MSKRQNHFQVWHKKPKTIKRTTPKYHFENELVDFLNSNSIFYKKQTNKIRKDY